MIGNPTNPAGEFARAFKDPEVSKFAISAFDSPNFTAFGITQEDIERDTWREKVTGPLPRPRLVDPAWVAKRWARWGRSKKSPNYMARVLGQFPDVAVDTLIPLHLIEAAKDRTLKTRETDEKILGVDVARFGSDESVFGLAHGPRYRTVFSARGLDTVQTAGHVMTYRAKFGAARAHVDEIGVGAGVVDQMKASNEPVIGINVGAAPVGDEDKKLFLNQRAVYYWRLREMFERGEIEIDPADEELAAQLAEIKFVYMPNGKIKIEAKEDAKARGLESPDRADAMMLAYAHPRDLEAEGRALAQKKLLALSAM
jgi:hypothetical protein